MAPCPRCSGELRPIVFEEVGSINLDRCPECQGIWFDKGELDRVNDCVWTNVEEMTLGRARAADEKLRCPRCQGILDALSPLDDQELVLDRCPSCLGFWLDKGELDRVRDIAGKMTDAKVSKTKMKQYEVEGSWWRWITLFTTYSIMD